MKVNVLFAAMNSVVKEEISKEMTELNGKKQPEYSIPFKYFSFQNTLGKIPHHLNNIDVQIIKHDQWYLEIKII